MYLVHYNPETYEVLGYLDPQLGFYPEEDGTAYFSISSEIHEEYSEREAWTDGKIITNVPPPNRFAELTVDGWVTNKEAQEQALNLARAEAVQLIDNTIGGIYQKFGRFQTEYDIREKQALAFKKAKYKGEVPSQIQAVVEPTGMTPKQATELILSEADKMRGALEKLGVLRMQKLAMSKKQTIEEIQEYTQTVLAKVKEIAKQL